MNLTDPAIVLTLKSSLLLGVAGLAVTFLRRRSASARHAIWTMAFGAIVALPFLSIGLPDRFVPLPGAGYSELALVELERIEPGFQAGYAGVRKESTVGSVDPSQSTVAPADLLRFVFVAGVLLSFAYLCVQLLVVTWVTRRAALLDDEEVDGQWIDACDAMGVGRSVSLRISERITTPVSVFLIRKVVLVPPGFSGWPRSRRDAALLHEVAHLARRDSQAHLVGRLALAISWWNPFAWYCASQHRRLRELACDEHVLASGESTGMGRESYAAELLAVAREPVSPTVPLATGMARSGEIGPRIRAALRGPLPSVPRWVLGLVGLFVLFAAGGLAIASPQVIPVRSTPVESLRAGLRDGSDHERLRALIGVAMRGERDAFLDVVPILRDPNPIVRAAAVAAVSRMGCEPGYVCVALSVADADPTVRAMALARLEGASPGYRSRRLDQMLDGLHPKGFVAIRRWFGVAPRITGDQLAARIRTSATGGS